MSWLSKQLKSVGKVAKKTGKAIGKGWEKIDDFALPAVGFALGGPAGAALGSAAARGIGDGKFDPKATLMAGAKGYGMGALGSAAGLTGGQGLKALGSSVLKAGANPIAAAKGAMGMGGSKAAGGVPNIEPLSVRSMTPSVEAAGGMVSRAASAGGSGGGFLDKLGGVEGAIDLGMGALSGYQGYQAQKKADKLSNEALALARSRDAELAPMRQAGIQRLMSAQRPDLSSDFASANPFARPLKRIG